VQLDYRFGLTRGSYEKLYDYNSDFNYTPAAGTIQYSAFGKGNTPAFMVSNGVDYLNPANYALASFKNSTQNIRDQERSTAVNLKFPVAWGSFEEEEFKVGLSGRWRERSAAGQPYSYSNLPSLPLTSASNSGNVNFYDGQYNNGPAMTPGLLQNQFAANQYISANDATNALLQTQSQRENVTGIYGQYEVQQGKVQVIGGLRAESTTADYASNAKGVDAAGGSFIAPISQSKSYNNFFPSLQAKYALDKKSFVRAALSSTIARPGFNQVTAALVVNPSANTVTQGNPNLKPVTANSFDLAYEHYLNDAGIFSIGLFDKEIKDYIAPRARMTCITSLSQFSE
jgi:TonB-dependent receptor